MRRSPTGLFEFDIQNVTGSSIDSDGFLLAQHDEDGEAGGPPMQLIAPLGMLGRPLDPVVDQSTGQPQSANACMAFRCTQGSNGFSLPLCDPREVALMPALKPGERIFYGAAGQFHRLHEDGSHSLATTDAGGGPTDSSGNSAQTVTLRVTPTSHERWAPWGQEFFDGMGWRVTHVGGAKMSLGYISGLPGPMAGGNSTFRVQCDLLELNAGAVAIGPTGSDAMPVAQATPLVAVLTTIGSALEAIQQALLTITPGSATTGGGPASEACAPAVSAAVSAISGALEAISTQSAIG